MMLETGVGIDMGDEVGTGVGEGIGTGMGDGVAVSMGDGAATVERVGARTKLLLVAVVMTNSDRGLVGTTVTAGVMIRLVVGVAMLNCKSRTDVPLEQVTKVLSGTFSKGLVRVE